MLLHNILFTVRVCVFLVIPVRLSLSLSLCPPLFSLVLPLTLIPCFN